MKLENLTGKRFGRLTVLERAPSVNKRTMWLCQCDCGNKKVVEAYTLKIGESKSCGCLRKEAGKYTSTHGMSKHPLYKKYMKMVSRCECEHNKDYENYGGRGIKVCDEWRNDFMAFYDWSLKNGYKEELTIARIDNDRDYSPDNCRYVTKLRQNNNRRSNRFLEYNGEIMTMADWGRKMGIDPRVIEHRLNRSGWPVGKALTTPLTKNYKKRSNNPMTLST